MHTTIRDLMAREQVRQAPAAPVTQGNPDQDDEAMLTPDEIGQQEQEAQMKQEQAQQQGEFPMHEVNADPQRYPVDHAKALHSFLKNAAGGTGTFTTANKDSHEMAKTLARSGHLQHHGARPGGAGGGLRHVWSLTPKGMAAIGQAPAPKRPGMGGQQRPGQGGGGFGGPRQGGQVKRPGMFASTLNEEEEMETLRRMIDGGRIGVQAYGTPEGVKKAWDTRGRGRNTVENAHKFLIAKGYRKEGRTSPTWGTQYSHPNGHFLSVGGKIEDKHGKLVSSPKGTFRWGSKTGIGDGFDSLARHVATVQRNPEDHVLVY